MPISNYICPICKGLSKTISWKYLHWDIVKCATCNLEFAWPFRAGELDYYENHETYSKLYSQVKSGDIHPGNLAISREIDLVLKKYGRPYPETHTLKVLDYGCGSGYYSSKLNHSGNQVFAVDFNPEMIRIAKEIYSLNAVVKSAEDLLKESMRFGLIICNQVLEHIDDPIKLLIALRSLLSNGGILFISVPNRNFIRAKSALIKGKLTAANYPPHHISFWSEFSLKQAFYEAGFTQCESYTQTYPEALQTEARLKQIFDSKNSRVLSVLTSKLGKIFNIQGAHLFGVGVS